MDNLSKAFCSIESFAIVAMSPSFLQSLLDYIILNISKQPLGKAHLIT